MTIAVVAEKPSVARDIARVLGAGRRADGVLEGNGFAVTWAVGHLVTLAEPHQIKPQWKRWRAGELPMIPEAWPLEVVAKTRDRFEVIARLLRDPAVDEIVCATDAGREGELIFRYIYDAVGVHKPVKRLWVSSLTEDAIRQGFDNLRSGEDYDRLADAARGRARADWLVGMNLSRAYTLAGDDTLSVGRVQTPTLAMLVDRELAIREFVAEEYREVSARFAVPPGKDSYEGIWFRELSAAEKARAADEAADAVDVAALSRRLPPDGEEADRIVARTLRGRARVASVDSRQRRMPPPLLYDLTELQRHANRLFGYSAKRTLEIAQSLYETKKLLSYPRTDSRHLSQSVADELPKIVGAIQDPYREWLAPGTGERPLDRRYVDDARVTDHHAIIPTPKSPARMTLGTDEQRIYDLVCRRLLSAWHEDHLYSTTTVITEVDSDEPDETDATKTQNTRDRFRSFGTMVDREGWKVLDIKPASPPTSRTASPRGGAAPSNEEPQLPSGLAEGLAVDVSEAKSLLRKTRPPRRFNDSTLLTGMETAGRTLDDKQLSDAMRRTGLGTPATRASIIETLITRGYVSRNKKALAATDKGIGLIAQVHPEVRSPRMTGEWEARLQAIEAGEGSLTSFMSDIEGYVKGVVQRVVGKGKTPPAGASPANEGPAPWAEAVVPDDGFVPPPDDADASVSAGPGEGPGDVPSWATEPAPDGWESVPVSSPAATRSTGASSRTTRGDAGQPTLFGGSRPAVSKAAPTQTARPPRLDRNATAADALDGLLHERFGFKQFRPHQEAVCRAVVEGRDALLVMPTGAGKSLCYQLPGIARAGTTLVVSPLIALMEDQVAKLREQGFVAERIHSGRKRTESRQVMDDYLDGRLDFLFIAPERLGVPGFPERLARRKPALVAIDEAHCISQWGHDFRPDYRMLGERLPLLRPTPIIALTATATPIVQRDIVKQLDVPDAELHIHGFRRDNIYIELVELRPGARNDACLALLAPKDHRPAIVYAPTRKKAEDLARSLKEHMPAAVYHAGIPAARRDRVQSDFLGGKLDVIVATIAFGMGIDKADVRTVVHMAMPASIEGYYQEIGRAGRDGLPSRAVLYHSYADRRTHEWFLDRDYPDPGVLRSVYGALGETPVPRSALDQDLRMDPDIVEKALEKLWIHGGARVDPEDRVSRGSDEWELPYKAQREHRQAQLDNVGRFAENASCHMLKLVRHFGDQADSGKTCGHCASCRPEDAVALDERPATSAEQKAMCDMIDALRERDGQSKGRMHKVLFGEGLDRKRFEVLVGSLVRARFLHEQNDSFDKDGETIQFRRLHLTEDGRRARASDVATLRVPADSGGSGSDRRRSTTARKPRARGGRQAAIDALEAAEAPKALVEALKRWRTGEAKRRRCPAFRILTDRALMGIARAAPRDEESLLAVKGMGPTLVRKYGSEILAITSDPS